MKKKRVLAAMIMSAVLIAGAAFMQQSKITV